MRGKPLSCRMPPTPGPSPRGGRGGAGGTVVLRPVAMCRLICRSGGQPPMPTVSRTDGETAGIPRDIWGQKMGDFLC